MFTAASTAVTFEISHAKAPYAENGKENSIHCKFGILKENSRNPYKRSFILRFTNSMSSSDSSSAN